MKWEERWIAFLGCLVFVILGTAGEQALGEDLNKDRYIPPSQAESFCVNYVASLAAVLSSPQGSMGEALAMTEVRKTGLKDLTQQGIDLFLLGEGRGNVFPFLYKSCIMLKGGNV